MKNFSAPQLRLTCLLSAIGYWGGAFFLSQCTAPLVKSPVQWGKPVFTTPPSSAGSVSAVHDSGETTRVLFAGAGATLNSKDDARTELNWTGRLTFHPVFAGGGTRRVPFALRVALVDKPSRCAEGVFRFKAAGLTHWIDVDSKTAQPEGGVFVLEAKGVAQLRSGEPLSVEMAAEVTRACPEETITLTVNSVELERTPPAPRP